MDAFLLRRTIGSLKDDVRGRYETNVSSDLILQFDGSQSQFVVDVHGIKKSVLKVVEGVDYVEKGVDERNARLQ